MWSQWILGENDWLLPTTVHFAFQIQRFLFLFHVSWSHFHMIWVNHLGNLGKSLGKIWVIWVKIWVKKLGKKKEVFKKLSIRYNLLPRELMDET